MRIVGKQTEECYHLGYYSVEIVAFVYVRLPAVQREKHSSRCH
jgi:hypothetical protein